MRLTFSFTGEVFNVCVDISLFLTGYLNVVSSLIAVMPKIFSVCMCVFPLIHEHVYNTDIAVYMAHCMERHFLVVIEMAVLQFGFILHY